MANTFDLIQKVALTSAASSVSFTSIPATYNDLAVYISAVGTTATAYQDLYIRINNDSSGAYNAQELQIIQSAVGANKVVGSTRVNAVQPAATYSNNRNNLFLYFFNYVGSTRKHFLVDSTMSTNTTGDWVLRATVGDRDNTAIISRLDFLPAADNFAANSIFTLYGIKNS
jgi:hypothetical protein